jgi:large subunit ribosomal protein L29
MKKAKDFRGQTTQELMTTLNDLRRDYFMMVNQNKFQNKLEKPHLLRVRKKEIARLMTVLNEKRG